MINNWQPIDTAPKDGRPIDLWVEGPYYPGGHRFANSFWFIHEWDDSETPEWRTMFSERVGVSFPLDGKPTHWMPIPAPPPPPPIIQRALNALNAAPDVDPAKATRAEVAALHAANLAAWAILTEGRDPPSKRRAETSKETKDAE